MLSRWRQPEFVWYAAYGSNLRLERFRCYLEGGQVDGNTRFYEPCEDPLPPRQILPLTIPHQLMFAGESPAWTGGVAFIKPVPGGRSHARAYLISIEQYRHLVCGENNVSSLEVLPLAEAISRGSAVIPGLSGRYDELVYLGHRGAYPALTITASQPPNANAPAPAYLLQVIKGLQQLRHGPDEIISYLVSTPGLAGLYSRAELRHLLRQALHSAVNSLDPRPHHFNVVAFD